ncbi:MAG: hypothetical protein Q7V05_12880 [Methanoregula sp.]|nr:hypothetical protein [Methanoregula sp.]
MTKITIKQVLIAVVAIVILGSIAGIISGGFPPVSQNGTQDKQGSAGALNDKGSTAIQSFSGPAGKYVYMVTIIAPQGGHVITGEYLLNNKKGLDEWKFFQYENLDIKPGDWQMPYGNASQNTIVEIHKVTNLSVVGDADLVVDGEVFPAEFFIDEKGTVTSDGPIAPVDCYNGIPMEFAGRLPLLKAFGQFGISNCSADPVMKVFTLTIFNNHDPVAISQFQALKSEGWTVHVNTDTALEQSMLRTHEELHALKDKHPELRIAAYDLIVDSRTRPVQRIVEVFVKECTPENRALDGTEVNSWKIRVLELYEMKRAKGDK